MSNSAFLTKAGQTGPYARVTLAGDRQVHRLPLPFTVGTSPLCDVIVNVAGLAPVGRIVTVQDQRLAVLSDKGVRLPMPSALADLGIQASGPIAGTERTGAVKVRLLELAARERDGFARWPKPLQKYLGGGWTQRQRLSAWTAGAVAMVAAAAVFLWLPSSTPDLSRQPIALTAGQVHTETTGSSKSRVGYERGVTYTVSLPADTQTQLLAFEAGGLSEAQELTLLVNGKQAAVWNADADCVETFCQQAARLDLSLLQSGSNTLQFVHKGESPYLLRKLLVSPLPLLSAAEQASVDAWVAAARRSYDDRHILADNLVDADRLLKRASQLLGARDLNTPLAIQTAANVTALAQDVDAEMTGAVHDLWFKAEKHARLRERDAAERVLATLLRLFPDPKDPAHVRAEAMRKSLEEMQP